MAPHNIPKYNIRNKLKNWLLGAGRIVIAGIGNPIRKDDSVGLKITQNLQGKTDKSVFIIECETVPEDSIQDIIDFKPTHILLIDAAILGLEPGECRLLKPEETQSIHPYSTHMLPLRMFCEYLSKVTEARIGLLLLQPKDTDFGEGLSKELSTSAKALSEILLEILRRNN